MPNVDSGKNDAGIYDPMSEKTQFTYLYGKRNIFRKEMVWERQPKRHFIILNPEDYRGELGARKNKFNIFANTDKIWIINGTVGKADGNFFPNFNFDQIGLTGLYLGGVPNVEKNVLRICESEATAVLDIQTYQDHEQRDYDPRDVRRWFAENGIREVHHVPVDDSRMGTYVQNLYTAA